MKIKIKNVFEPEKQETVIDNLENDKNVYWPMPNEVKGEPNITIKCRTKSGYPVFINMSKTACLAISFVEDSDD